MTYLNRFVYIVFILLGHKRVWYKYWLYWCYVCFSCQSSGEYLVAYWSGGGSWVGGCCGVGCIEGASGCRQPTRKDELQALTVSTTAINWITNGLPACAATAYDSRVCMKRKLVFLNSHICIKSQWSPSQKYKLL